ncbi:hypothetical protein FDH38_gp013 [Dinoroseobacter phage vB_DshS-R5C]|uniref:Uncharacterized protein n=1 Tax=Dinoroseobacter phage vB_DshS-R5C TaxID=1965368 RepID=A0A1V0DY59_9CAUD|nr:hypothetical protein FDH38_gp013 [Dinoroseobacter phage vB_DshS-R5C]ARB06067.1 hypothetical protein vBDshSR5C_13 [Dinoroseobacter phage vB_DshS-R5C]
MSPAEARRLARIIDANASRNPVPFQYRVRTRPVGDRFGAWTTLPGVHSSRADAEKIAKAHRSSSLDVSITENATDGY